MTALIIALIVLGNLPILANTNSTAEVTSIISTANSSWCCYSISGKDTDQFNIFVNRGHVDVLIIGDGSSDLDLYVYIGDTVYKSDGNSDDEKVCLGTITRSGNIRIRVVNRGWNSNEYQLILK